MTAPEDISSEPGSSTASIRSGSANGLLEYLDFLVEKGYAKSGAITPLKSASKTILRDVDGDNFGEVDMRSLDVDEYFRRFENIVAGQYKHESLLSYKNRFSRARAAYLQYLSDSKPPTFKRSQRRKSDTPSMGAQPARDGSAPGSARSLSTVSASAQVPTATQMIDYPFPLRTGQIAHLRLPVRLEKGDAERIGAFLRTLVFDAQVELPERSSSPLSADTD